MTRCQRSALRIALLLVVTTGTLVASAISGGPLHTTQALACCNGSFYGANSTKVNIATQSIFPQYNGNYCGIETAMAMTNYVDEDQNFPLRFTSQSQQNNVVSDNNLYLAESQWGYLILPGNNVAGKTNISLDFGTDPRSIAYMAWTYTPANNFFHNEIYRWQFVHTTQPSYAQQVLEATTNMAAGIDEFGEPVRVAINAGEHSVLVTGVYSTNDVLLNFPAGITGVTYRDPQDGSHQTVDLNEWTYGVPYGYSLWSQYYGNPNDPEPGIGPYAPGARQVHWYQGFNWISRDYYYANGQYSPDWAFDSYNGSQLTTP